MANHSLGDGGAIETADVTRQLHDGGDVDLTGVALIYVRAETQETWRQGEHNKYPGFLTLFNRD